VTNEISYQIGFVTVYIGLDHVIEYFLKRKKK